jgi:hypothetical protein
MEANKPMSVFNSKFAWLSALELYFNDSVALSPQLQVAVKINPRKLQNDWDLWMPVHTLEHRHN